MSDLAGKLRRLADDDAPDCDCSRPNADAAHTGACAWVCYIQGHLWLEQRWRTLARCLADTHEVLRQAPGWGEEDEAVRLHWWRKSQDVLAATEKSLASLLAETVQEEK